jgi:hypothetical protein
VDARANTEAEAAQPSEAGDPCLIEQAPTVVRLPRFVSVPECTMPQSDERCTQVICRYHLANRRCREHRLETLRDCALSVANEGEHSAEEIAQICGRSKTWVRKLEVSALEKLARCAALRRLYDEFK